MSLSFAGYSCNRALPRRSCLAENQRTQKRQAVNIGKPVHFIARSAFETWYCSELGNKGQERLFGDSSPNPFVNVVVRKVSWYPSLAFCEAI